MIDLTRVSIPLLFENLPTNKINFELIPYFFLGQLAPSYMVISLILLPLAPIGIIIGYYLHKKISEKIFYKFIYIFLAIGGIKLIYDGIF